MSWIYLDNNATTRLDPRVFEAMRPFLLDRYANPSSIHQFGQQVRHAVETAREQMAALLGLTARQIVFTSGATESNNLAIRGVAESSGRRGNHIISVATEHSAILDPLDKLSRRGYEVTLLPFIPSPDPLAGRIRPEQVADALRDDTMLVSVMPAWVRAADTMSGGWVKMAVAFSMISPTG